MRVRINTLGEMKFTIPQAVAECADHTGTDQLDRLTRRVDSLLRMFGVLVESLANEEKISQSDLVAILGAGINKPAPNRHYDSRFTVTYDE